MRAVIASVPAAGWVMEIVPVGEVDYDLVAWLADELQPRFGVRSTIGEPFGCRAEWFDPSRGQHCADLILDSLVDWRSARGTMEAVRFWSLGVADLNLYAADRPFVFGVATVGGCCALIGIARLRDGAGPATEHCFRERVLKEAVHELGHVAGLEHCPASTCVMYSSPGLAETDRKTTEFCAVCTLRLIECLNDGS
ncbi:MAG: hypothetical protein H0X65_02380 [Gemmatimonadetes bacterium]|nr:hypothetical protein [Gemmatimonadota bacterium]